MSCKIKCGFRWHMAYCLDGLGFDSRLGGEVFDGPGFDSWLWGEVLDGPGFDSRLAARFSIPAQRSHEAHPASCAVGTGVNGLDIGFVTHSITASRCEITAVPHLYRVQLYLICTEYSCTSSAHSTAVPHLHTVQLYLICTQYSCTSSAHSIAVPHLHTVQL